MARKVFTGGDKLDRALKDLARKVSKPRTLNVGFLEGATYPDGTPVAYIAAIQEYGTTIDREASTTTIYRKVKKNGDFAKNGRFVKKSQSNYATDHAVGAYKIVIPSRPFFRTMIANKEGGWGGHLGKILVNVRYDTTIALKEMGELIQGELQTSIRDWTQPPNARSTVAKKGFNKPLIDSSHMVDSASYEVKS